MPDAPDPNRPHAPGRWPRWRLVPRLLSTAAVAAALAGGCREAPPPDPAAVQLKTLVSTLRGGQPAERREAAEQLGELRAAAAVEPLVDALADTQLAVQLAAARALQKIANPAAVDALGPALRGPAVQLRVAAADALGAIGDPRAIRALLAAFGDEDLSVRLAAADALAKIGAPATGPVSALASDPDPRVRAAVVLALGRGPALADAALLLKAATDGDSEVRAAAAEAIGQQKVAAGIEVLAGLVVEPVSAADRARVTQAGRGAPTTQRAAELADRLRREQGDEAFAKLSPAEVDQRVRAEHQAEQQAYLAGAETAIRRAAARALTQIGTPAAIRALLAPLADRRDVVRAAARDALSTLGPGTARVLAQAVGDATLPLATREEALRVLIELEEPEVLPALVAVVKGQDASLRTLAAQALAKRPTSQAADALLLLARDPNVRLRTAALRALASLGDRRAVEPVLVALGDSDADVAQQAIAAAGALGDPRAVDPLLKLLAAAPAATGRGDNRVALCRALGQLADRRAVPALLPLLNDPNQDLQGAAAEALGQIGDRQAVEPLLAVLPKAAYRPRFAIVTALGRLGDPRAIDALIERMDGATYHELADTAAQALGRIPDQRALDYLMGRLGGTNDVAVQAQAAKALVLQGERAIAPLAAALASPDATLRGAAAQILGRIGPPAIPAVLKAAESANADTLSAVIYACSTLPDPRVRALLVGLLKHDTPAVRAGAAWALGLLGDAEAVAAITPLQQDGDEAVRRAARAALDRIREAPASRPADLQNP